MSTPSLQLPYAISCSHSGSQHKAPTMYWGKEQARLAESETELPSRGTDLHPSKIPLPSRNFSDVIPGTLAKSHSPAHVSTRLLVIIYSMCVYDMSFLFFNECFICVGPIFPLDHQRPLKVGFLLFLSLCLMTTCSVQACAPKGEDHTGVSKDNQESFHSPSEMQNVLCIHCFLAPRPAVSGP